MDVKQRQFGQRLHRINQTHRKLAGGYVTSVNHDGLIIAKPSRKNSHQTARSLFFCLIILLAFKAFLHAQIGPEAYEERVQLLQSGTVIEQFGAYVMFADPLTVWVGDFFSGFVR